MDIKDIKNEKLRVEFEIADILQKLEEKTGLSVIGMRVTSIGEIAITPYDVTKGVKLDVELN